MQKITINLNSLKIDEVVNRCESVFKYYLLFNKTIKPI